MLIVMKTLRNPLILGLIAAGAIVASCESQLDETVLAPIPNPENEGEDLHALFYVKHAPALIQNLEVNQGFEGTIEGNGESDFLGLDFFQIEQRILVQPVQGGAYEVSEGEFEIHGSSGSTLTGKLNGVIEEHGNSFELVLYMNIEDGTGSFDGALGNISQIIYLTEDGESLGEFRGRINYR